MKLHDETPNLRPTLAGDLHVGQLFLYRPSHQPLIAMRVPIPTQSQPAEGFLPFRCLASGKERMLHWGCEGHRIEITDLHYRRVSQ